MFLKQPFYISGVFFFFFFLALTKMPGQKSDFLSFLKIKIYILVKVDTKMDF